MTGINRRSALSMVGVGAAVAAMDGVAPVPATAQSPAPTPRRTHQPRPLPFSASRLDGLSDPDFSPLIYGDIKREQLHRTGSVVLHEIYFGNLGGDGRAGGDVQQALASAFGSLAAWEAEFRRTATALAGGSGWSLLALNVHTGDLQNYWMWDHMHAPATGIPLLALDMYEHAYHMDYGSAAARYIDAFMRNVNWEEVDRRYSRARRAVSLA
jgi:Fe-Mn family superoxide dismutase